jgi:hypothetical protein
VYYSVRLFDGEVSNRDWINVNTIQSLLLEYLQKLNNKNSMQKIIFILCSICLATFGSKAQNTINKIEVVGEAEIEVGPDYFEYSVNLQEYIKPDNEKVSIEILEKSLIAAVEEIGLKKDKLTINAVNGNSRYSSDNKPNSFLESRSYVLKIKSINDINNLLPKLDKLGLAGTSMTKMTSKKVRN